jgi:hypothetical protein
MPRDRAVFVILSVFFLAMVTGPASAGTINVLGFVDFGPGGAPTGVVNLGGDRGFTLNFGEDLSARASAANCAVPECPPGATISLNAFVTADTRGHATLDGVSYPFVGCCGPPPFPWANARVEFTGQTVAPPFGDFTKAILTVPVGFSGTFSDDQHVDGNFLHSSEQLLASATATLTLDKFDFGPQFGVAWQYEGIRYELEPVPEPTTLLLWGTTMAGLGVARCRRRGRQHAA